MRGAARLLGAPIDLGRQALQVNRAQWRTISRQWQRQLSQRSRRPALRAPHPARTQQRHASTLESDARSAGTRTKNLIYGTIITVGLGFAYLYVTDTRASIHHWLVTPTLRLLYPDAEDAHHAGTKWLQALYSFNLHPRERGDRDGQLGDIKVEVFGHVLDNPIGTSAGIDKNGEVPSQLLALGPAIVEVGGATPMPQEGNPKPRVFRLPSQDALINRYGLNSQGADSVAVRLRHRLREFAHSIGLGLSSDAERVILDGELGVPPGSLVAGKLLAVQVAKNKTTPDRDIAAVAQDYVYCVERLAPYADILVVNVSSPNTPGLRSLQATAPLTSILTAVVDAAQRTDRKTKPAVMVKVSPDEDSDDEIEGICTAVWASGVDGVIVGNTTNKRPDPIPKGFVMPEKEERLLTEVGGYSGPQMFQRTLDLVTRYRTKLDAGPPPDQSLTPPQDQPSKPHSPPTQAGSDGSPDPVDASVQRDLQNLKPSTPGGEGQSKQPLIQLPKERSLSITSSPSSKPAAVAKGDQPKVIFATGGITNGAQCLQILNAGASICQIYTAMIYGGVGTVTRMKKEMRQELAKKATK